MKIENKKMNKVSRSKDDFKEYLLTLKKLKPGQSFVTEKMPSHYRLAISISQVLLGAEFACRTEGNKHRVGRVS